MNKSDLSVSFPGAGKFTVDGSDNIESLRGKSDWGGVALDEFAFWNDPAYAWEEVIEPNLIVNHAFVMIGSTTNGYDYFHRMMKRGDHKNEIEGTSFDDEGDIVTPNNFYQSYRYTSFDNPFLDRDWLESKRETMSTEAFNREYLARFEKFRGLIYKEFDRTTQIVEDLQPQLGWRYYRTMDFGAVNPTVCLWVGVDNSDNIYIFDEYYNTGQTAESHANIIIAKTRPDFPPEMTFGDPSAQQEILDYGSHGVVITQATRLYSNDMDWVASGIEKVRQALKINSQTGRPRLYVSSKCVNTIREFETYHWMLKKSTGIQKDMPEKVDDHCMDALRYFFVSYMPQDFSYESFGNMDMPRNSYTGYSYRPV